MGQKRYFWLKLFDDFFSSKRIKKLRSLAGGDTYTIIYLKMQLKSLKTNGYLYFDGVMKDFAEEIALDIDENAEDVKVTIQYLLSVGLIECSESGEEYYLSYMQNLIGSESASTQRVREHRQRKKEQEALHCNTDETQVKQVGNADIDIEKDIDKKKNNKKKTSQNKKDGIKHHYGEYNHVVLTDLEYKSLCDDYGEKAVIEGIRNVDEYCQEHGKKYTDYNLTLRRWGIKSPKLPKKKEEPKSEDHEMTDEEWERYVQSDEWENN